MSLIFLVGMLEPRELWSQAKVCLGCGLQLEPERCTILLCVLNWLLVFLLNRAERRWLENG
jgi:hypothetical protein